MEESEVKVLHGISYTQEKAILKIGGAEFGSYPSFTDYLEMFPNNLNVADAVISRMLDMSSWKEWGAINSIIETLVSRKMMSSKNRKNIVNKIFKSSWNNHGHRHNYTQIVNTLYCLAALDDNAFKEKISDKIIDEFTGNPYLIGILATFHEKGYEFKNVNSKQREAIVDLVYAKVDLSGMQFLLESGLIQTQEEYNRLHEKATSFPYIKDALQQINDKGDKITNDEKEEIIAHSICKLNVQDGENAKIIIDGLSKWPNLQTLKKKEKYPSFRLEVIYDRQKEAIDSTTNDCCCSIY